MEVNRISYRLMRNLSYLPALIDRFQLLIIAA